ncbi:Serine/threonine-protein kinase Nek6-like protein [Drosera capensis]
MEEKCGVMKSKMDDYEVVEQIGRGGYESVFLVLNKDEQKMYVLKKMGLAKQTDKFRRMAIQEMEPITNLDNPYIVEYKDTWTDQDYYVYIVSSHIQGGDMAQLIKKARGKFSEEKVCKWMVQMLLAIDYLHSKRILHKDLKCSNIFLTKEGAIQIGGYGLAKLLGTDNLASSAVGTPNYMCPELHEDMPYGYKSDIWALGCCMFEIAAHQPAFKAPDLSSLMSKINRSVMAPLPVAYSPNLKQIIKSMLRKKPEHRPTAADLLRHPHIQPYLLRFRTTPPIYLPIRSPNSKEKTTKPSPTKPKDMEARALKLNGDLDLQNAPGPTPPSNRQSCDKSSTSGTSDENLETKRVDPISYLNEACDASVSSIGEPTSSDAIVPEREELLRIPVSNGNGNQGQDEPVIQQFQQWASVETGAEMSLLELGNEQDITMVVDSVNEVATPGTHLDGYACNGVSHAHEQDIEVVAETTKEEVEPEYILDIPRSNQVYSRNVQSHVDANSTSSGQAIKRELDYSNADLHTSGNHGVPAGQQSQNSTASGINDVTPYRSEVGADMADISSFYSSGNSDTHAVIETPNISSLSALTAMVREVKNVFEIPGHQRADALESLLELCARLLKEDKIDDLAGVLRPFGEEVVSSRETAIWLTKSLMAAHKAAKAT